MGDGGDGGDGGNGRWEMGDGSWGMEWMQTGRRGAGGDEDGLRYGGMLFWGLGVGVQEQPQQLWKGQARYVHK
jgi:hypothetical protein